MINVITETSAAKNVKFTCFQKGTDCNGDTKICPNVRSESVFTQLVAPMLFSMIKPVSHQLRQEQNSIVTKVVLTHHPSLERKQQGYKKDGVSRHCVVKTWLTLTWQNTQAYQEHVTGDPTKQHVKQGHEIRNRAKHPASKQERNYAKILYKTFCHIWKYNFQILRLANKELSFSKRIIIEKHHFVNKIICSITFKNF